MSDIKIKPADIWAEIQKIAAESPDHVYLKQPDQFPTCSYERNGEPSCIVGRALFKLGVGIDTLKELDAEGEFGINEVLWAKEWELFDLGDKTGFVEVVLVQRNQDNGIPWGRAVRQAAEEAPEVRERYE